MIRLELEHNSPEWLEARLGKFTSSKAELAVKDPRSGTGLAVATNTYLLQVVSECLTGQPVKDDVSTASTKWGHDLEPIAFEALQVRLETPLIRNVCYEDELGFFGSPDGEDEARSFIFDIKCPYNSTNHVKHLLYKDAAALKKENPEYYWQLQMNMMLAEVHSSFFVSFDPRFDAKSRLKVLYVLRDIQDTMFLRNRLVRLCNMRDEMVMDILKA